MKAMYYLMTATSTEEHMTLKADHAILKSDKRADVENSFSTIRECIMDNRGYRIKRDKMEYLAVHNILSNHIVEYWIEEHKSSRPEL